MEELKMATAASPESGTFSAGCKAMGECWFDDACILDMDYFVKTLSGIKAKGVRPELIGSIITHYASKWLPDLTGGGEENIEKGGHLIIKLEESSSSSVAESSVTASWMKKRFLVETLIGILPPEKDSIPCNFLLRLLRIGNMVGVEAAYRAELEKRISWQLEQATLRELMIPSFSHTCGTVLDVELVLRLVKRFVTSLEDEAQAAVRCSSGSGAAAAALNLNLIKVAKLVDNYLAEAAVDSNLTMSHFISLAAAIPTHARATDDALYRSIDTYLKAHPGVSKEERKRVCKLIDSRKLSAEASIHAAQNERLPVRAVIQVLLSEQTKLSKQLMRQLDWSGSFISAGPSASGGTRSPNPPQQDPSSSLAARCMSKRDIDMNTINIQRLEIKKLKEEVLRLQSQCINMQAQIEKLLHEKKRGSSGYGFFSSWKKIGQLNKQGGIIMTSSSNKLGSEVEGEGGGEIAAIGGFGRQTPMPMPMDTKARLVRGRTSTKWRKSLS